MNENVRVETLPNGVRVATSEMPQVQSVSLGIWVGAGGRHEPAVVAGISHFIEHMLFKGTRRRSAREISQAIEGIGGYLNAFTQEESTCFYARVPFDGMGQSLDVLADMYRQPRFDPGDLDRERQVIVEEIMMYRDQPQHEVHELLTASLWCNHPLGRPLAGRPQSLARIDRNRMRDYMNRTYVPGGTVVTVAGNMRHDAAVAAISRMFKGVASRRPPTALRADNHVGMRPVVFQSRKIEQTHLAMGFRLFGLHDRRRHALRTMNVVLGENMSSRLFQRIREERGLAYSVHSGCHLLADTGVLGIDAGMDAANLLKTVRLVGDEIRRLKRCLVPADELDRAREYCIGQLRIGMESTSSRIMWMGEHLLTHGRVISPEETIAAMRAVTSQDIRDLAQSVLTGARLCLAVVSPPLSPKVQDQVTDVLATY